MPRHRRPQTAAVEDSFDIKPKPKRTRTRRPQLDTYLEQVEAMMSEGTLETDAEPKHLVALYAWCHRTVYGVSVVSEFDANAWRGAISACRRLVDELGSVANTVAFIRWVWKRENGREAWRRNNGREGSRITWRAQFVSRHLLTDWKLDMRRKAGDA